MANRKVKTEDVPIKRRRMEKIVTESGKQVGLIDPDIAGTPEDEERTHVVPAKSSTEGKPRRKIKDADSSVVEVSAKVGKPKASPKNDAVTKILSECDTQSKMLTAIRKHPSFPHINKDAFKRAVEAKDDIGNGLLRMRLGNMLRSAISKSKKK